MRSKFQVIVIFGSGWSKLWSGKNSDWFGELNPKKSEIFVFLKNLVILFSSVKNRPQNKNFKKFELFGYFKNQVWVQPFGWNYFTCPSMLKPEIHQTRFPSSDQLFGKPPVSPYSFYPNTVYVTRRATCKQFSIQTSRKEFQSLQKMKSVSLCALVSTMNKLTNQRARRSNQRWLIDLTTVKWVIILHL